MGIPAPRSYEEQIYHALVRAGDVCFDVGANSGEVSLFLAKLAGESGRVVAFEPVWPVYCELCRVVQRDPASKAPIVTMPCGLADSEKEVMIHVPDGQFGMGSMADAAAWAAVQPNAQMRSYPVRLITMDGFLGSTDARPPEFMKIDVEGAELLVLRGAAGFFGGGGRPLMLIEMFAPWEQAFGYQPWEPLSLLMRHGYRFLFACPGGLVEHVPTEARPFPPEYEMGYNVIAFDEEAHAERIAALQLLRAGPAAELLPMPPPPRPNRVASP